MNRFEADYYLRSRNNRPTTVKGGVGVTGLLGVAFIILKLIGVIDWSWVWVLCPFWFTIAFFIVILIIAAIADAIINIRNRRRLGKK